MITKLPWFKRQVSRAALLTCIFSATSAFALPQAATPTFSPASGTYTSAQAVTITSATPHASIAYTTDGSIPTESGGTLTHGTLYSGAITISTTTTLTAIAFENGYANSAVAIDGYTLQAVGSTAATSNAGPYPAIRLSPAAVTIPTLNVIFTFSTAGGGGIDSSAPLVQGIDGNFYGTTTLGGSSGDGTVFKLVVNGSVATETTLASFNGTNGLTPSGALVQGTDGNFYGTTESGGLANDGNVFKVTPTGTLTSLVDFTGPNGSDPVGGLVQGDDGNFYGTTSLGGSLANGSFFVMTPSGALRTLFSFGGTTFADGLRPNGVIEGNDGNFYGTAFSGGDPNGDGTIFKITSGGSLSVLATFNASTLFGNAPAANLVQGLDGDFYGTTSEGGTANDGVVFKLSPFNLLVSFNGSNGSLNPQNTSVQSTAALVQGSDGNFYGTTQLGGSSGKGTIFMMSPAGVLSTLFSFDGTNGQNPNSGLVQGSDGNFYGIAGNEVFQLMLPPATAAPVFSPVSGTYTGTQTVTITSATSGASIRYTINGSTPTETTGTVYSGPVSISSTTTLSAIAYKSGLADSAVITPTYTIQIPGSGGSGSRHPPLTVPATPSGGGGAPSWWFLGFLAFAGVLRWKLGALTRANPKRQ